jgi:hypothetical protein
MKPHSKVGRAEKERQRKPKRRNAPKVTRRRGSAAASLSTKFALLEREWDEALEQQAVVCRHP